MTDLLDDIPEHWSTATFEELNTDEIDKSGPRPDASHSYVEISSIDNDEKSIVETRTVKDGDAPSRAKQRLEPKDLLISKVRPNLNGVALVPPSLNDALGSTGFYVFRSSEVDSEFYYYYCQTDHFVRSMMDQATGTSYPAVRISTIDEHRVPVPPIKEQESIVRQIQRLLSRLDAGKSNLELAEKGLRPFMDSSLEKALQGGLTRGVRRNRSEDWRTGSEVKQEILDCHRAKWQEWITGLYRKNGLDRKYSYWDSRYPEPQHPESGPPKWLPDEWDWVNWTQVAFVQNGTHFPSEEYQDDGVRLLRPGNLHESGRVKWNPEDTVHMPKAHAEDNPDYLLGSGELVMNLTAQSLEDRFLGRVCLTSSEEPCLLNQRIARIVPIQVSTRYLFWVLRSPLFRRFVNELNTGTMIQHMSSSDLDDFDFPLPPIEEQRLMVNRIEECFSLYEGVTRGVSRSDGRSLSLRKAILSDAFQGKLHTGPGGG